MDTRNDFFRSSRVLFSRGRDAGPPRQPPSTLTGFFPALAECPVSPVSRPRKKLAKIESSICVPGSEGDVHPLVDPSRSAKAKSSGGLLPRLGDPKSAPALMLLDRSSRSMSSTAAGTILPSLSPKSQPQASTEHRPRKFLRQLDDDVITNRKEIVLPRRKSSITNLCLGDSVTTEGGPDERGPWRKMGYGIIKDFGDREGYFKVKFATDREACLFDIKANNLKKVSDIVTKVSDKLTKVSDKRRDSDDIVTSDDNPYKQIAEHAFNGTLGFKKNERNLVVDGVRVGGYVTCKHDPWRDMGLGYVKSMGSKPGTVRVQFNIMGDVWTLKCKDLENVKDPGHCMFQTESRNVPYPVALEGQVAGGTRKIKPSKARKKKTSS